MTTTAAHPPLARPHWLAAFPARAWCYWLVVCAGGAAAMGVALGYGAEHHWARFALLTAAASLAQLSSVRLKGRRVFHPAIVFVVAGALVLTPQQLVLMVVVQHVVELMRQRYAWYVPPYNIANYALAALAALGGDRLLGHASIAVAGAVAAFTFVAVNRLLLAPMITLSRGLSLRETRLAELDDVALELVLALMAIPLVFAATRNAYVAVLALAPLVLIHVTQRATSNLQDASETIASQNESLEDAHQTVIQRSTATLEALSATVDARDRYTAGHSTRVREFALAIGTELALPQEELEIVGQAALLHDIGKIGVPDSVLQKQGPLDDLEWIVMKGHPDEGARIVSRLGYLDEVVPAIRHHHERPDGRGYPDGLHGEEIPLGARIIHVADALDAMTSKRLYRAAMPLPTALGELQRGAGTDFCATTVAAATRAIESGAIAPGAAHLRKVVAA